MMALRIARLRRFYGLTELQARLVAELAFGEGRI